MTKKLFALLLATVMLLSAMTGCRKGREVWYSVSGEYVTETETETTDIGTVGSASRTRRTKSTTSGKGTTTTTRGKDRVTNAPADALTFKPVDDGGANYDVKGTVSIAVDTVRVTDYEAMFDTMQQLFPNIKFEFDWWAHTTADDSSREYMTTRSKTGTAANIIWDDASALPTYLYQKWIKPITKYVANDPEMKNCPKNLLEDYTYFGEVFALPHQATYETLVFNTRLQKELGIKDSEMPGLEWTLEEYEELLRKASKGFSAGKCVAVPDLFETYNRVSFYLANNSSKDAQYGPRGFNYKTNQYEATWLHKGAKQMRDWRVIAGAEGWFMQQSKTANVNLLQQQLGVNDFGKLWLSGKAFMDDTLTVYTEKWRREYPNLEWKQWTYPNKDGKMMVHVDHCFVTETTPEDRMDAVYQVLRFMTVSTNGNLARLTMYEDSQKGKYTLNSHVYYPTSTSKAVIDKFNKLSCTDEVDEYLLKNIGNSVRYDGFKLVYNFGNSQSWGDSIDQITDGKDVDLAEPAAKINRDLKEDLADFEKTFKKNYK